MAIRIYAGYVQGASSRSFLISDFYWIDSCNAVLAGGEQIQGTRREASNWRQPLLFASSFSDQTRIKFGFNIIQLHNSDYCSAINQ